MFYFLVVLIAILAILIVGVVLLQSGKGGGLAGIASAGTTQILGARQAPDVLEKATWALGGAFMLLCLLTAFFVEGDAPRSVVQGVPAATTPAPVVPGAPSQAPATAPANPVPAPANPVPAPANPVPAPSTPAAPAPQQ